MGCVSSPNFLIIMADQEGKIVLLEVSDKVIPIHLSFLILPLTLSIDYCARLNPKGTSMVLISVRINYPSSIFNLLITPSCSFDTTIPPLKIC